MKRRSQILIVLVYVLITCSPALALFTPHGLSKHKVKIDDRVRHYLLYTPKLLKEKNDIPVLISLHGGGGTAKAQARLYRFYEHAIGKNWIVVYPQGVLHKLKSNWNDGRVHTQEGKAFYKDINDVQFLFSILQRLKETFHIKGKTIFLHGVSNGAFMAQRVAIERTEDITAVAAVIGSLASSYVQDFQPSKSLSMLMINGTEDPLIPYRGGQAIFGKKNLGKVVPIEQVIRLWAKHNRCNLEAKVEDLPNLFTKDDCRIQRVTYPSCKNGASVELLKMLGGGHTSPGDKTWLPKAIVGNTCYDIDAIRVVMSFFERSLARLD